MASRRIRSIVGLSVIGVVAAGLSACAGTSAASSGKVELTLVAYSTPQAAYQKIIAAFQATPAGKNVVFKQSYGASGDQSRAVAAGQKADYVAFALEPDITRLVKAGLVAADWNSNSTKGMVTDSVVAIVTRKGNPKHVKGWDDIVDQHLETITPNPFTSGGARWNVMAAYGAASDKGANKAAGVTYLTNLFSNVPVQDDSARKALVTFTGGKGDVMLSYENEAIFAKQKGQPIDYVVPDKTILIENPAAVTKSSAHPTEAKAFLDFVHSDAAQKIFADNGYRPTAQVSGTSFPTPSGLFTIDDLGGWTKVTKVFFDPQQGVMAKIEQHLGQATAK
jgi:sulfate/thiosulfate-binding protein